MNEELTSVIERALGKFPDNRLLARVIILAIRKAGFKIVPVFSEARRSGGLARAKALSPERRREIAKHAAATRWGNEVERCEE